ncbi:MAG TPA: hypothetical protein VGC05_16835 [Mycobacterium sp.]
MLDSSFTCQFNYGVPQRGTDNGRSVATLIGSSLSSTGMSADYLLALNRTNAGRASSPTRGAITNDPFPCAGHASGAVGREQLPSAIVMHQSAPLRADFRISSPALAWLSGAFSGGVRLA